MLTRQRIAQCSAANRLSQGIRRLLGQPDKMVRPRGLLSYRRHVNRFATLVLLSNRFAPLSDHAVPNRLHREAKPLCGRYAPSQTLRPTTMKLKTTPLLLIGCIGLVLIDGAAPTSRAATSS